MEFEVVDDEKTKWSEVNDMDAEKKARRSSILKPQKPRNPLSTLDFSETNSDNTSVRASRRVSFASSNFVKPFAADPEKNTIWDNTYEEEVNHTDSTKSSCDQTHGTKTEINMTSTYSITSDEPYRNEKMVVSPLIGEYIDVKSAEFQIVNDVVNSKESLVSFARKLRSNSTSEQHSKSKMMDFTLMDTTQSAQKLPMAKLADEENSKSQENAVISSFNKTVNYSGTTSTMEITSCITDKENVNPLINDLSLIVSRPNINCRNQTEYFNDEDLDYTTPFKANEETDYLNKFDITNLKAAGVEKCIADKKNDLKKCESVMEFTCITFEDDRNYNSSAGNLQKYSKKDEATRTVFEKSLVKNQLGDISMKTVYSDNSMNTMEFTNLERSQEFKQNKVDATSCSRSKIKTIIFDETAGNMELTIANDKIVNTNGNIEKLEQFPKTQSLLNRQNKTIIFNHSENDMECTTSLPVKIQNQGNLNSTELQSFLISTGTEEMIREFTNVEKIEKRNQNKTDTSSKRSKRKTIIFNETEGNMDLTFANDNFIFNTNGNIEKLERFPTEVEQNPNIQNESSQKNKTIVFSRSENETEFTNLFPVKVQDKDNLNITQPEPFLVSKNKNETILFKDAEEDIELTNTFNTQNIIVKDRKKNIDLKKTYSEQSEIGMELTNTLIGKIDFAASPTNIQADDMELTSALPSRTITENVIASYGNEENMELTCAMQINDNELKHSESTMEFTHTLVGKIDVFGNTNVQLDDMELTSVSQYKTIGEKVSEIVENNESVELTANVMPFNVDELKPHDMSLTQNLTKSTGTQFMINSNKESKMLKIDSSEIKRANLATSYSSNLTQMVDLAKLSISDMQPILHPRDYETSSVQDMINSEKNCNRAVQLITSKSYLPAENTQNTFACNTTDLVFKNDLSTINVSGSTNDIKRHVTDCPDGDIIKKRRIERSPPQNEETDLCNLLPHIKEHVESSRKGAFNLRSKKLSYPESKVTECIESKRDINTSQEINKEAVTSSSNVLYSESLKTELKTSPKFISCTNLCTDLNTTTPATSFHINLSCMEDTQQLIHATFSKPETLKMLGNFKDTEQSFNSSYKVDNSQSEETVENLTYKSPQGSSRKEISTREGVNVPILIKDKTFSKGNNKSLSRNFEKPVFGPESKEKQESSFCTVNTVNFRNGYSDLLIDTTPPVEVAEEFDCLGLEAKLSNSGSDKKLISESSQSDEQDNSSKNVSSDCMNYTLRAQTVINNIQKYLLRYEPFIHRTNLESYKLPKKYKDNCCVIKELCKRRRHVVDLEEAHKQDEESLSSENEVGVHGKEDSTTPSAEGVVTPKSLCQRVCEMAKRTRKYWEFVKKENDYYYFYTVFGTLPFKVHIHPELGYVYNVLTYSNLADNAQPICHYQLKLFQHKLKQENLLSVLGQNFDIFTLLDYIYMSMEEVIKFDSEYMTLVKKYGETHHFRMNPDFSITFEILNMKLIIFWTVTIKLSPSNLFSVTKEDITAMHKVGQNVNEEQIKTIAENTTKGPNFLRNFVENVDEYVQRIGKRIKK